MINYNGKRQITTKLQTLQLNVRLSLHISGSYLDSSLSNLPLGYTLIIFEPKLGRFCQNLLIYSST